MKHLTILLAVLTLTFSCQQNKKTPETAVNYPETKQVDTVDTYFGVDLKDPYRWLEDDRSTETETWVKSQNEVTFGYLEQIPFRNKLKERLTSIWNYERIGAPFIEGDYTYFYKKNILLTI